MHIFFVFLLDDITRINMNISFKFVSGAQDKKTFLPFFLSSTLLADITVVRLIFAAVFPSCA